MSGTAWKSIHEGWESIREPEAAAPAPFRPVPRPRRRDWFGWLTNTPWWLISAGVHVVLLLAAALVYVERALAIEDGAVEVLITRRGPTLPEIERPADVFERKGIPKDDGATALDEPAIFFPEAKQSDHNESADNDDYRQMKGESKSFLSYTPGDSA